jgi:hypothetical protein
VYYEGIRTWFFKSCRKFFVFEINIMKEGVVFFVGWCHLNPTPNPSRDTTAVSFSGLYITHNDTLTHGSTLLDERSELRRALYLTTHNTHKRQWFMYPAGFETATTASEHPPG